MSRTIIEKIKIAEEKRKELFGQLFDMQKMVRGTFCQIYVKCGKKTCTCNTGKGHPHRRMSWHEKGKSFSRAVPKEDHEWIEGMTGNFREYRRIRKEILNIEKEIDELLDFHEEEILKKTIKGRKYLDVQEYLIPEGKSKISSETEKKQKSKK